MHLIIGKANEEIAPFPNIALDILQKSQEAHVFLKHLHISVQSLSKTKFYLLKRFVFAKKHVF